MREAQVLVGGGGGGGGGGDGRMTRSKTKQASAEPAPTASSLKPKSRTSSTTKRTFVDEQSVGLSPPKNEEQLAKIEEQITASTANLPPRLEIGNRNDKGIANTYI